MRPHLPTALVLSLTSCALFATSCVQSTEPASQSEGAAPILEPRDEDEPSDEQANGDFTYYACMLVKDRSESVRATFCGSLSSRQLRAQCYSHLQDGSTRWANYCYDTFYDE
jgi:hypothetical protein